MWGGKHVSWEIRGHGSMYVYYRNRIAKRVTSAKDMIVFLDDCGYVYKMSFMDLK